MIRPAGFLFLAALFVPLTLPAAELPRGQIVLSSALSVDPIANTVMLPLHEGEAGGQRVWYIVTDASGREEAQRRSVVHAPLLARVGHVQAVERLGERLRFAAAPDFAPARRLVAGREGYPPRSARPGAVAPAAYSPFIRIAGESGILNAPVVAVGDGPFDVVTHANTADRVLAIDTGKRTVTLLLSHGFAEGRRVVYISTEASDPGAAVLERAIHVPGLARGDGDIGLLVFVNGQRGDGNPQAQGLQHLLRDGLADWDATAANARQLGSPRNILTAFPTGKTAAGYSPLWSITKVLWSAQAGDAQRHQAAIYRLASAGTLRGDAGAALQPAGFVVNCPVIAWLDAAPE